MRRLSRARTHSTTGPLPGSGSGTNAADDDDPPPPLLLLLLLLPKSLIHAAKSFESLYWCSWPEPLSRRILVRIPPSNSECGSSPCRSQNEKASGMDDTTTSYRLSDVPISASVAKSSEP